jgi:hypothetical protein
MVQMYADDDDLASSIKSGSYGGSIKIRIFKYPFVMTCFSMVNW